MLPIVWISSLFIGAGVVLAGLLIASAISFRRRQREEAARLQGVVFAPTTRDVVSVRSRLVAVLPTGYIGWLERQLVYVGRPDAWPLPRVISTKFVLGLFALAIAVLWVVGAVSPIRILLAIGLVVIAFMTPDLLLYSRATERQQLMAEELPDTLDQMTIAVEAGLGFDSAMSKVGAAGKGPLADEFVRTLQDMSLGMSRREAYESMGLRTSSEDIRRFTRAIGQAESYGIAVANVLRVQAGEMRLKRRQLAEERAMKIPVKIVFPLTVCILPVLFIVILTPAVLNLVASFS
ncbi:MAG: type II secretion system F family protein [Agromyces sp.]